MDRGPGDLSMDRGPGDLSRDLGPGDLSRDRGLMRLLGPLSAVRWSWHGGGGIKLNLE